jgi:hypothetical protein
MNLFGKLYTPLYPDHNGRRLTHFGNDFSELTDCGYSRLALAAEGCHVALVIENTATCPECNPLVALEDPNVIEGEIINMAEVA